MDLHALRSFLVVVTHGGFSPASRKLGAPKSTLSRHVRELEDSLGVRLLERSARGFRLTAEGESLFERGARGLAEIEDAERALRSDDGPARGPLRIAVPHVFAHRSMGRLAADFVAKYPGILLEVTISDSAPDLIAQGLDVAIVLGVPDQADLVARTLGVDALFMVAAPSLVRARRRARAGGEAPWPAVVPSRAVPTGETFQRQTVSRTWSLTERGRAFQVVARPVLRLPSKLAIRDAVMAGAGAALLPSSLVREEIARGELVRLGTAEGRYALCIVHSSSRLVSRRVRAFVDFMVAALDQRKPSRVSSQGRARPR